MAAAGGSPPIPSPRLVVAHRHLDPATSQLSDGAGQPPCSCSGGCRISPTSRRSPDPRPSDTTCGCGAAPTAGSSPAADGSTGSRRHFRPRRRTLAVHAPGHPPDRRRHRHRARPHRRDRAGSCPGRVDVIRDFSTGYHARNGGGDSITTDGDLPTSTCGGSRLPRRPAPARRVDREREASPQEGGVRTDRRADRPRLRDAPPGRDGRRRGARAPGARRGIVLDPHVVFPLPPWLQAVAGAADGSGEQPTLTLSDLGLDAGIFFASWAPSPSFRRSSHPSPTRSNVARVIVMIVSTMSIGNGVRRVVGDGAGDHGRHDPRHGHLDILVLLALSSRDAAAYARRNERR